MDSFKRDTTRTPVTPVRKPFKLPSTTVRAPEGTDRSGFTVLLIPNVASLGLNLALRVICIVISSRRGTAPVAGGSVC